MTVSAGHAASPPKLRPYTGVGLLVLSWLNNPPDQELSVPLYAEPGLSRVGTLTSSRLFGNGWLFDVLEGEPPLVISARKGDWVRVIYDDAGREAWLDLQSKGHFVPWDQFLKRRTVHLLPGLQQRYYQLQQQPDKKMLATLTLKHVLKVLRLEGDWAMVLVDQSLIGWLRWRDDDGRLLLGFEKK